LLLLVVDGKNLPLIMALWARKRRRREQRQKRLEMLDERRGVGDEEAVAKQIKTFNCKIND
jgi:hypothetical protein